MTLDEALQIIDSSLNIEASPTVRGDEIKAYVPRHRRADGFIMLGLIPVYLSAATCQQLSAAFAMCGRHLQDGEV